MQRELIEKRRLREEETINEENRRKARKTAQDLELGLVK